MKKGVAVKEGGIEGLKEEGSAEGMRKGKRTVESEEWK